MRIAGLGGHFQLLELRDVSVSSREIGLFGEAASAAADAKANKTISSAFIPYPPDRRLRPKTDLEASMPLLIS
jgi:hypothetical protein